MAEHNDIGKIGENIATSFLMKQGFYVVERNFRVFQGEIDIIVKKDNCVHFIEVKSIKVDNASHPHLLAIQPEDNLTFSKREKLEKTIRIYLTQHNIQEEGTPVFLHLACVYVNTERREGRVKMIWNI